MPTAVRPAAPVGDEKDMPTEQDRIVRCLPSLRRYSRCLTGSQERGDRYVRACLESILAEPSMLSDFSDTRVGLFRVFHDLLVGLLNPLEADVAEDVGGVDKLERHILALPPIEREALLLRALCDFTTDEIAVILRLTSAEAEACLHRARDDLKEQTTTRVLIIEDEPVIAFDLAAIVSDMGHEVLGIADTRQRAVAMARKTNPGIVLADIQLRDGSSGIDAAAEILEVADLPVIFITAYPERLLTGERREPTYLITKPFDPELLQVTISQALLLHPTAPSAEVG